MIKNMIKRKFGGRNQKQTSSAHHARVPAGVCVVVIPRRAPAADVIDRAQELAAVIAKAYERAARIPRRRVARNRTVAGDEEAALPQPVVRSAVV